MAIFICKLRPKRRPHFRTHTAKWTEHIDKADPQCCPDHTKEHIEEIEQREDVDGKLVALVTFDTPITPDWMGGE